MSDDLRFLLDNPDLFILHYFRHKISELEPFHVRLIKNATQQRRGLILYPAAHGKTTLVSTLLPIWAICNDPNVRIAIITKNDADAKGIMRAIQFELVANEELIRDFGPFKPEGDDTKAWALERFDVERRTVRDKSATVAAFGAGARTAIGYRTDWTICDDIITDKNSATPDQRQKAREWFNLGPETMMDKFDGRLTVVGTVFHPEDLYHDLMEMTRPDTGEEIYFKQIERAIVDDETHETLWPSRRPWLWLMERKAAMGTLDFNKRYMNIAVDPSRLVFREEYLKGGYVGKQKYPGCIDKHHVVGSIPDASWRRFAGFDPAIGKVSHSSKFCAHVVLAVGNCRDHERCIWVLDMHRDQMTLPQQVDLIIGQHQHYDLLSSVIEANSYQAALYQACKHKLDEQGIVQNLVPHYTTRTNKPDPESGVQAMAPWFENGQVHIPWGNPESQRVMQQLVDELIQFPSGRTSDTVMAFWMAWRQAQEQAPRYISTYYVKKPFAWHSDKGMRRFVRNPAYPRAEPEQLQDSRLMSDDRIEAHTP